VLAEGFGDREKSQSGGAGFDDDDAAGRHLPLRWVIVVLVLSPFLWFSQVKAQIFRLDRSGAAGVVSLPEGAVLGAWGSVGKCGLCGVCR
jgi:hypothetical protein